MSPDSHDTLRLEKHCPMCGAVPGEPCLTISGDDAGKSRPTPHFYRHNDAPIPVLIPDEPPYA